MRCLVTGISGHLGSSLARMLLAEGHEVAGLIRPGSDLWRIEELLPRVSIIKSCLADLDQVAPQIKAFAPETVFHLAWFGITSEFQNDMSQIEQNLMGSIHLLQIAQQGGCRCWIGLGSQAEYGIPKGVLDETQITQPVTLYGVTKLSVGHLTRQLCAMASIRWVWLRLLATYGPKDNPKHLIPTVINRLLRDEQLVLTPGQQRWDYLYVDDAAEALCAVASNPGASGLFVLGSGDAHAVREIVETARDLICPGRSLEFGGLPYGPSQIMHLQADISRLKQATGWKPRTSLHAGLKSTIAWDREHS